jgi:Putative MetA-pathway of phenol degradation
MIRPFLLFTIMILGSVASQGQNLPSIATDRPDQTECPFIVPTGFLQAENGFLYEKTTINNQFMAYPSVLWKYGLSTQFELRLITELVSEDGGIQTLTGLTPIKVGFKVKLSEEKGFFPKTSFIGHLSVPKVASKAFRGDFYAPSFRFTMQHTLSNKFILAYNLGAEWDGVTPETTFIYTLTTGFSMSEKSGLYVELYGFVPQTQRADHRLDGGFTYLINNHVMMDLSGGIGLSPNAPPYFLSLGLSYRFKVASK